jgi:thioredoxin reductase
MATQTDLLVIGAGPYACSAAAYARERGISTHVVGRPMAFWREQMPQDMYLRSGPDWHLDPAGADTFEGFLEDAGTRPEEVKPVPISVFLSYTEWFIARKGLDIDERYVAGLAHDGTGFVAAMEDGSTISAERVLAVPGIRHFASLPDWHTWVPPDRRAHTSDLVSFDALAGARVVVVGGRQSAYEWAALLCDHGAARVDVVHRHATPRFAEVSWAFCNEYVDQTLAHRGWWRTLPAAEQQAIAQQFWEVGRLTLEPWLPPRLAPAVVTSHPGCSVTSVSGDEELALRLSDGTALEADFVVFASGYRADLASVPYLTDVLQAVSVTDGFPDLTEGFETSLPGLSVVGFASTRDFGPFYGFTKGCPSAARIAVDEMLR